jgi:class 3 adenylate cyclase
LLAAIAERGATAALSPRHAASSPAGERRQVTILFADLCGFTQAERLRLTIRRKRTS